MTTSKRLLKLSIHAVLVWTDPYWCPHTRKDPSRTGSRQLIGYKNALLVAINAPITPEAPRSLA